MRGLDLCAAAAQSSWIGRARSKRCALSGGARAAAMAAALGGVQVEQTLTLISGKSIESSASWECTDQERVAEVADLRIEDTPQPSAFVKPKSIFFRHGELQRRWDMVQTHESVATILYNRDLNGAVVVRQFRPPVYASLLRQDGVSAAEALTQAFTYELCAGISDKPELALAELAAQEVYEETGYRIAADELQLLSSHVSSAGTSGAKQTLFYGEASESERESSAGGGVDAEGEKIDVLLVPESEMMAFLMNNKASKSAGLCYALAYLAMKRAG